MVILTVYALRTFTPHVPDTAWPTLLALVFTVALHLWRRNVMLSVLGGTADHVALAGTLFASPEESWETRCGAVDVTGR
ncbi:AzlD domain-containing protein [Actinacidiphila oryziradicis]|uniref:Uncharacterized protein n=1 Tax=Actinacidiphila oryziradicis TaxID=2571141 RepID=A0A4U0SJ20_9ACTN|nr:AzlD domain-containing protein [Actinacidiphila oryziradicis]TKA08157.1 hypothetical protein FCI23_29155 [Actinacidiphila oryziradicis]